MQNKHSVYILARWSSEGAGHPFVSVDCSPYSDTLKVWAGSWPQNGWHVWEYLGMNRTFQSSLYNTDAMDPFSGSHAEIFIFVPVDRSFVLSTSRSTKS